MDHTPDRPHWNRRDFIKVSIASVAAAGAAGAPGAGAAVPDQGALDRRNERPDLMPYRKLGRTNFNSSRLVFGCGAALRGGAAVRLLERAFETGINLFDVGYDDYYKGSEKHLGEFWARHQGDIFVVSKAPARVEPGELTAAKLRDAANYWSRELDASLSRLGVERVDAYYFMGVHDPRVVRAEELYGAFESARSAGKVSHLGISSHQNAQECLEAAVETGWYSLAMIAMTPAGWYDYTVKNVRPGSGTLKALRPQLDSARDAGIGLIGMKAARHIATGAYGGKFDAAEASEDFFDPLYDGAILRSGLNPFQRSYAYCLGHGLDAVNADMQNFRHFEENLAAVRRVDELFA